MKDKRLKRGIILIAVAALFCFLIMNFNKAVSIISTIFTVLTPFMYGFIIAYILKFPYNFFYEKAYKGIGKKHEKCKVMRKPLAIITTYVIAISVIAFLMVIIIPSLVDSFAELSKNIINYGKQFEQWAAQFIDWANATFGLSLQMDNGLVDFINKFTKMFSGGNILDTVKSLLSSIFPEILSTAKVVSYGVYNWIIGIVASIYFLSSKELMCGQVKKLTMAYAPKKWQNKIFEVTHMSNEVCGNFIIGRVIDSLIIGVLCYIILLIFNFDYALLIAVVVGITNVIPFFGPFLGAIPSGFILLMINPTECFWFVIIIVLLQQLDGNVIGPKVIGDKIGISGFWILFSVIVGSGLCGVAGMLMGIPAFVVIYNLLGKDVNKKLLRNKEYISKEPLDKSKKSEKVKEN